MMKAVIATVALTIGASPLLAAGSQPYTSSVKTFPYTGSHENYCPAGTVPVTGLDGISCGVPSA